MVPVTQLMWTLTSSLLVAIIKGMWTVKRFSNKIIHFLTGGVG